MAVRIVAFDHREGGRDIRPYLLERKDSSDLWAGKVELPDDLRSLYQFCPAREDPIPQRELTDAEWERLIAAGIADPAAADSLGPCVWGNTEPASMLEMPSAPPQPWALRRPGVPRGEVRSVETGREWPATVHVYTPAGLGTQRAALAVMFDAQAWMGLDVTATFDNLIADGVVPPFIAVLLGYPFGPTRVRGLTRPEVHETYLLGELLPQLESEFRLGDTILIGQSLGGLAAVGCALRSPGRFAGVASQSGSFWWPGGAEGEVSGDEVIASVGGGTAGTRFWVEAGAFEAGLVPPNRKLHQALSAAGLPVAYREFAGGHDFACWRAGLGDAIVYLLNP